MITTIRILASNRSCLFLQVLSSFTVVATTTSCLYFTDTDGVASKTGLRTAGVLILLLNALFLLIMVVLIVWAGWADGWALLQRAWDKVKRALKWLLSICGCCVGSQAAAHGISNASAARVGQQSPMQTFPGGLQLSTRGSSAELLRNSVFTRSGAMLDSGPINSG